MHIWIYFENELLRRQLKSGSSPNFFDTNVHGIEEVLNVLMIEMNKGIWYIYIMLIELWTRSPTPEVENLNIRSVFKCLCRYL